MIHSHIENDVVEFEIHGEIQEIASEIVGMVSAMHQVFTRAGQDAALEFRIRFLHGIAKPEVFANPARQWKKPMRHPLKIRKTMMKSARKKFFQKISKNVV